MAGRSPQTRADGQPVQRTPDTSFAASPFAQNASSPFKAYLSQAFPASVNDGFDDGYGAGYGSDDDLWGGQNVEPPSRPGMHARASEPNAPTRDELAEFFGKASVNGPSTVPSLRKYSDAPSPAQSKGKARSQSMSASRAVSPASRSTPTSGPGPLKSQRPTSMISPGMNPQRRLSTKLDMPIAQLDEMLRLHCTATSNGARQPEADYKTALQNLSDMIGEARAVLRANTRPTQKQQDFTDQALFPGIADDQPPPRPTVHRTGTYSATASPSTTVLSSLTRSSSTSLADSQRTATTLRSALSALDRTPAPGTPRTPFREAWRSFKEQEKKRKLDYENEANLKRLGNKLHEREVERRIAEQRAAAGEARMREQQVTDAEHAARMQKRMDDIKQTEAERASAAAAREQARQDAAAHAAAAAELEKLHADVAEREQARVTKEKEEEEKRQMEMEMEAEKAGSGMSEEQRQDVYEYLCHIMMGGPRIPFYDEQYQRLLLASANHPELHAQLELLTQAAMRAMDEAAVVQAMRRDAEQVAAKHAAQEKMKAEKEEEARRQKEIDEAAATAETASARASPLKVPLGGSPQGKSPGSPKQKPKPTPGKSPAPTSAPSPLRQDLQSPPLFAASPAARTEYHPSNTAGDVLRNVVAMQEKSRSAVMQKMLDLSSPGMDRSRLVEVSMNPSLELRHLTNSTKAMEVSIFPLPEAHHPKYHAILEAQLNSALAHLRQAALHFGAQHITQLRFGCAPHAPEMGRLTAVLSQLKTLGPDGPKAGLTMNAAEPWRRFYKEDVPESMATPVYTYEMLIESPGVSSPFH